MLFRSAWVLVVLLAIACFIAYVHRVDKQQELDDEAASRKQLTEDYTKKHDGLLAQLPDLQKAIINVEAYADDWSAGVTGWLKVGGVRSSVVVQASFGENGELTWAGGVLSRPEKFAEYPRIGTKAALERLTAQYNGAWVGTGGPMVRAADEAIAVGEPMPGSVATGTALPPDSIPTATLPVDTMPQPVETLTVDVERVEEELVFVWGADGSVYLVPGYAFVANQDGYESRYTVSAVPDEFVQQADAPVSDTVSPPAESTPTVGEKVPSGAEQTLVGLSEREAIAQAEANGWAVRVVSRDGVDLPVTMDYSESRVNLAIDADKVVRVHIG